jgi:hypothetical protein
MKALFSKWVVVLAGLIVPLSGTVHARGNDRYHLQTFELRGSRYFSNYNAVVARYLRQKSPHRRARACIVGLKVDGRSNTAWMIWRGGSSLILWEGGGENDLNRSRRNLSLRRDVVASDAAIGTSTYLVSRPWVAALERKCARSGRYVAVN